MHFQDRVSALTLPGSTCQTPPEALSPPGLEMERDRETSLLLLFVFFSDLSDLPLDALSSDLSDLPLDALSSDLSDLLLSAFSSDLSDLLLSAFSSDFSDLPLDAFSSEDLAFSPALSFVFEDFSAAWASEVFFFDCFLPDFSDVVSWASEALLSFVDFALAAKASGSVKPSSSAPVMARESSRCLIRFILNHLFGRFDRIGILGGHHGAHAVSGVFVGGEVDVDGVGDGALGLAALRFAGVSDGGNA